MLTMAQMASKKRRHHAAMMRDIPRAMPKPWCERVTPQWFPVRAEFVTGQQIVRAKKAMVERTSEMTRKGDPYSTSRRDIVDKAASAAAISEKAMKIQPMIAKARPARIAVRIDPQRDP